MHNHVVQAERATTSGVGDQVAELQQPPLDDAGISTAQSPPVDVHSELHDVTPSVRSSPAPSEVDSGSYSPLYNSPTDQGLLPDSEKKGELSYLAAASKLVSDAKAKVDVAGLQEIRKRIMANKMHRQKAAKRFARYHRVDQEVC